MRNHARIGTEPLDGLRGIAILLVLWYHTWLFSWYTPTLKLFGLELPVDVPARVGYLGVDVFFVISGFVLFFPHALRAIHGRNTETARDFAYRRFIKIVPSYALALAATAAAALPLFFTVTSLWGALVQHALFVHNSFPDGFGVVNSVFWSLAIEVQFYLIFPLLAPACRSRPFAVAACMFAVALAYRYATAACCVQVETVTRQLPAFLDVFAAGMLAAYLVVWIQAHPAWRERHRSFGTLAAIACAALTFAILQWANAVQYVAMGREHWDVANRSVLALAVAATALASCSAQRWWRCVVANPVLVFFSLISYNLYLWHTLLMIWMWKHGVPKAGTPDPHADDHWKGIYIACGWSVSIAIATAITYFIERPLLATVKPQSFCFDWPGAVRRLSGTGKTTKAPESAPSETRI